jgi:cytochrome-b5 reductase
MPNKFQFAFLATFVSVFSALVLISRFLNSKLVEAGYDYRNLILLGLPDHEMSFDWAKIQDVLKDAVPSDFHAVDVPYLGTYDLVAISKSPTFIITGAIILATAFLAKVLHSGPLPPFFLLF